MRAGKNTPLTHGRKEQQHRKQRSVKGKNELYGCGNPKHICSFLCPLWPKGGRAGTSSLTQTDPLMDPHLTSKPGFPVATEELGSLPDTWVRLAELHVSTVVRIPFSLVCLAGISTPTNLSVAFDPSKINSAPSTGGLCMCFEKSESRSVDRQTRGPPLDFSSLFEEEGRVIHFQGALPAHLGHG